MFTPRFNQDVVVLWYSPGVKPTSIEAPVPGLGGGGQSMDGMSFDLDWEGRILMGRLTPSGLTIPSPCIPGMHLMTL